MSYSFESLERIKKLISSVEESTKKRATSLTHAINNLKEENDKNKEFIRGLVLGDITELDPSFFGEIDRLTGYFAYGNKSLVSLRFPDSLKVIEASAFSNCSNLKTVIFNDGLEKISANCFNACTNLGKIVLPNSIKTLENSVFYQSPNIELDKLPDNLEVIGATCFGMCKLIKITEIPEKVTAINCMAFYNCLGLETLTIKAKHLTLTTDVFTLCSNLTTINVPWAEGEVEGAPWGATKAVINYNYTE